MGGGKMRIYHPTGTRRVLCLLLAFIMALSMLPGGLLAVSAAANTAIYYTNPDGWGSVCAYVWEWGTNGSGWPGTKLSTDPNTGYYVLDLSAYQGKTIGIVFNNNNGGKQTADLKLSVSSGGQYWCTSADKETNPDATYRTTSPGKGPKAIIHFFASGWSGVSGYSWYTQNGADLLLTDSWPGRTLEQNSSNSGWFDLILYDLPVSDINVIFSSGSSQTADIPLTVGSGGGECWITGNAVSTTAPSSWNSAKQSYTVTVHYYNSDNWSAVHNYAWDANGKNDYCATWPGRQISENPEHMGWYDMTLEGVETSSISCIFNNGSGGEGNQTADISITDIPCRDSDHDGKVEFWYADGHFYVAQPAKWTQNYTSSNSRKIYIPGTFPGADSWVTNANQMTYTSEKGIYQYTFQNVPAGTYEFKIAVNNSWDENYGVNGELYGENYSVTLDKSQNLTIWYSDYSHCVVTSLNYNMDLTATLSGSGIADTRLYDSRLTGVYSATVNLSKGTYSGLKITAGGKTYSFSTFTLDESTAVTFFLNPVTELYYHNAGTGAPINAGAVYYTTKDTAYKSVMGAVPNNASTTFRIQTGADVKSVQMVIGRGSSLVMNVTMKSAAGKNGNLLWSCNPDFSKCALGDNYWYYFVLRSEGSDLKVYSDDAGDYGTGKLTTLGQEWSYNLVVYKNGFKTPDWLKNAVIYQIFPDRFYNGNSENDQAQTTARGSVKYEYPDWYTLPENPSLIKKANYPSNAWKGDGEYSNEIYGGDLKGITEKIEYLKALGVTVIYLNPIFSSISNHRYDACDYTTIDPILGALGDFEELVAAAEANGMHIILDGVFNHVSDDSVYFDRYYKFLGKSEKIGAYPYWAYVYDLVNEKGYSLSSAKTAAKQYFTKEYGITDYSYTEWFRINNEKCSYSDTIGLRVGKKVYAYEGWWGYDSMPVIYSTNGSEYQTGNWAEEIIGNSQGTAVTQYWISKGSDGWRLDVANEVSDETWQRFRESVKAMNSSTVTVLSDGSTTYDDADDAAIVGEIWADAAYYLLGDMYDSVMNYLFRDAAAGFARTYRINRDNKDYNLDDDYTAWDALLTLESTRERYPQEAYYALMNLVGSHDTARILSYLDGVEDDGWGKENMANAFPSYSGTSQKAKSLQYMVALIQFTYPGAPTIYYGDEIGMVGSDDPDDRRTFEWGRGQKDLVEWYALLAQIRSQYAALRTGSLNPFAPNDNVMGYVRKGSDGTFVIMANRLGSAQTVTVNIAELGVENASVLTDLLTGTKYTVSGGSITVSVPAYSGVILIAGSAQKASLSASKTAALAQAYNSADAVGNSWTVSYSWTNAPAGVTLPGKTTVTAGGSYTVDTAYTSKTVIEQKDSNGNVTGTWTFSGWSKTGKIKVTGNMVITGGWTYYGANGEVIAPDGTVTIQPDAGPDGTIPGTTGTAQGGQNSADPNGTGETQDGGEGMNPSGGSQNADSGKDTKKSGGIPWWGILLIVLAAVAAGTGGYFVTRWYLKRKKS